MAFGLRIDRARAVDQQFRFANFQDAIDTCIHLLALAAQIFSLSSLGPRDVSLVISTVFPDGESARSMFWPARSQVASDCR